MLFILLVLLSCSPFTRPSRTRSDTWVSESPSFRYLSLFISVSFPGYLSPSNSVFFSHLIKLFVFIIEKQFFFFQNLFLALQYCTNTDMSV